MARVKAGAEGPAGAASLFWVPFLAVLLLGAIEYCQEGKKLEKIKLNFSDFQAFALSELLQGMIKITKFGDIR